MLAKEIWIIAWNSYPSRRVRRLETLNEYRGQAEDSWTIAEDFNFDEGDGISAEAVFNDNPETTGNFAGNYILVLAQDGSIASRWFVMSVDRTTLWNANQCRVRLRRDVVADELANLLNAKAFIEKGTVSDSSNPLIYNKEDGIFNKIKKSESLLKDETGISWIVGYIPQDAFSDDDDAKRTVKFGVADLSSIPPYLRYASKADCPAYRYAGSTAMVGAGVEARFYARDIMEKTSMRTVGRFSSSSASVSFWPIAFPGGTPYYYDAWNPYLDDAEGQIDAYWRETILKSVSLPDAVSKCVEQAGFKDMPKSDLDEVSAIAGKIVYFEDEQKAYLVSLDAVPSIGKDINVSGVGGTYLVSNMKAPDSGSFQSFSVGCRSCYSVSLKEVTLDQPSVVITKASLRPHLIDAPYDMFAIPYADGEAVVYEEDGEGGSSFFKTDKATAMSMAIGIAAAMGSGTVYDVQELPYCPVREAVEFHLTNISENKGGYRVNIASQKFDKALGAGESVPRAALVWCRRSSFSFEIPASGFSHAVPGPKVGTAYVWARASGSTIDAETLSRLSGFAGKGALQNKLENQLDSFRLSSPNMSSAFEFSASANGGVSAFRVDCTYRPFSPYIHVAPRFGVLYGSDFGDARGLICGGDYSLAQLTSAWADYQQNNKNYQAVFDRQIQNMEVTQRYQRVSDVAGGISGAIQAGVQGASMGSVGGPIGAIAGGVAGTALSAAGAVADWSINEALRKEAIDYTKDLFSLRLGNVQAIPYGLSKTSAINANNKHFPFLEWYSCTDLEEEALKAKIEANGMTVGVIGSPSEYVPIDKEYHYVKGELIRPEDDSAMSANRFNALAEEFLKGVYIRRL